VITGKELLPVRASPIDLRNWNLADTLWALRQALDIYWLVWRNWGEIEQLDSGKDFLSNVTYLSQRAIILDMCSVYEKEKKPYELCSIDGIIRSIFSTAPAILDFETIREFIQRHDGPLNVSCPLCAIESTFKEFRSRYEKELLGFKTARDKLIAHSEFRAEKKPVASFDVMERMFNFGADFYSMVTVAFLGRSGVDLKSDRPARADLKRMLRQMGVQELIFD
jgi:hypothetical protein